MIKECNLQQSSTFEKKNFYPLSERVIVQQPTHTAKISTKNSISWVYKLKHNKFKQIASPLYSHLLFSLFTLNSSLLRKSIRFSFVREKISIKASSTMFGLQKVLRNQIVRMTIINQISAAQYSKVSHVIFDLDGLLLGE